MVIRYHTSQLDFQTVWILCLISLHSAFFMGFLKCLPQYIFERCSYSTEGIGFETEETMGSWANHVASLAYLPLGWDLCGVSSQNGQVGHSQTHHPGLGQCILDTLSRDACPPTPLWAAVCRYKMKLDVRELTKCCQKCFSQFKAGSCQVC